MSDEIWKPLDEYDGELEISNYGNVREKLDDGTYKRINTYLTPDSYVAMSGLKQNGKLKFGHIHRLVAKAFVSNPDNKPIVNHIDNNPTNNRADNLEWVTQKENLAKARAQGCVPIHTKIVCVESKQVYASIRHASDELHIRYLSVLSAVRNNTPIHGLHFRRVKE